MTCIRRQTCSVPAGPSTTEWARCAGVGAASAAAVAVALRRNYHTCMPLSARPASTGRAVQGFRQGSSYRWSSGRARASAMWCCCVYHVPTRVNQCRSVVLCWCCVQVKLVLERSPASMEGNAELLPPWYFKGREGVATWQVGRIRDRKQQMHQQQRRMRQIRGVVCLGGAQSAGSGCCQGVGGQAAATFPSTDDNQVKLGKTRPSPRLPSPTHRYAHSHACVLFAAGAPAGPRAAAAHPL